MKKLFGMVMVTIFMMVMAAACQAAPAAPTAQPTEAPAAANPTAEVVLTIVSHQGEKAYTMDDLKKLPAAEGMAGIKSSTGKITPPVAFKGVLLTDLLKEAGGADSSMGVQLEAKDGYAMTFSYDQIKNGDFITYDPGTGDEIQKPGTLKPILAYEMEGKPLDKEKDGYLRVVVISDKANQVVDGHWSIKFINKFTLKSMAEEWTLDMVGAVTDALDRGSFESCSSKNCHVTTWKDEKAQTWSGIPLYILVGRIDDETKHGTGAYNSKRADEGYTIELVAKDGYSVKLDSARVKGNQNLIVANQVNGNMLEEKDLPLKLVGSDVNQKEDIGAISKIILHLNEKPAAAAPEAETTATPTELAATPAASVEPSTTSEPAAANPNAALTLEGMVDKPQSWSMDDLKKMEVIKASVEHPKKGKMDVEGLNLNALLDLAIPKVDAKKLVITASDGYVTEVELKSVQECKDCLVYFNDDGGLNTAMPGMESSFWAKNMVKIEVK